MILKTPTTTPTVEIEMIAPTVVAPGARLKVVFQATALQTCEFTSLDAKAPGTIRLDPELGLLEFPGPFEEGGTRIDPGAEPLEFPVPFEEGQTRFFPMNFITDSEREDFGELEFTLGIRTSESETNVTWPVWISVFERATVHEEEDTGGLSDRLRDRLIAVVNAARTTDDPYRNGHIFLADPVSFFDDYLNIEFSIRLAKVLLAGMVFQDGAIPVSKEVYGAFALGLKHFFGILWVELIPEEECEESDDRFDPDDAREVESYEISL